MGTTEYPPGYPYPRLEVDGFQLAVIEQDDTSRVLADPLPSDEERFSAGPGQLVKLVFDYNEPDVRPNGAVIGGEHMWVRIVEQGEGYLLGALDSSPQHTHLIKTDDPIKFHPKHIIAFWRDN